MILNKYAKWTHMLLVIFIIHAIACNNMNDNHISEKTESIIYNESFTNSTVGVFLYSQESFVIKINGNILLSIKNQSDSIEYLYKSCNFPKVTGNFKISILNIIDTCKIIDTTLNLFNENRGIQYSFLSSLPMFLSFCSDSTSKSYDAHKLNISNSYRHISIKKSYYSNYRILPPHFELLWTQYGNRIEIDQWKNYCIETLPYEREIIKIDKVIPRKEW